MPIIARSGNVSGRARIHAGDVNQVFASAYRVYEHRFTTPLVHPGYTEPRTAVADWDANSNVTVWSNTQLPFDTQNTLAEILDMPAARVRVIVPGIGGGFGGKLRIGVEHFAALLARKTARPVKVMTTSEEELTSAYPRQATVVTLKTRSTARDFSWQGKAGSLSTAAPLPARAPAPPPSRCRSWPVPTRRPALALEGIAVYTNKVPSGSFRAPAGPMANFAVESQMDMIAKDLGIDPLEIRLRNIVKEGDLGPSGEVHKSVSIEECLRRAAGAIGWDNRSPEPGRGKGIACSWWMTTGGSSGVYVKINPDGTATLVSGAVEIGSGAITGAAQVLAEELSLDSRISMLPAVDTQTAPFDYGAQGSRTAFSVGNACIVAARDLRRQMFDLAAGQLGVEVDAMSLRDKHVVAGEKSISIAELARISCLTGGGLIAHGTAISPSPAYDPTRLQNHPLPAWNTPSYHAHAVDLSVDPDTGSVLHQPLRRGAGCGICHQSNLYRGTDRGRRGAGNRPGAVRRNRLWRRNGHERQPDRLQDADGAGYAGCRMHSRRMRIRGRSLWRQGRRRAALHPAAGGDQQCHRGGHRFLAELAADDRRKDRETAKGRKGMIRVEVHMHGNLRRFLPDGVSCMELDLPDGTRICDVIERLRAEDEIWLASIGEDVVPVSAQLIDKASLNLFPILEGG